MKVQEEREKTGLKLDIQKTKIIVSGPITSWQIDGKKMGTVTDYFLRLQNHCRWWLSHEIKRHLLLGKKAMINLDSILKSRDNTLLTSLCSQRYGFSSSHVWMWELDYKESWTLKNWCLRTAVLEKTLQSPLEAGRSSQSILKEINPEYSLEKLMLKTKFQYSGHLKWRVDLLEKILRLGKTEGRRRRGKRGWDGWMSLPTQWTWVWAKSGS